MHKKYEKIPEVQNLCESWNENFRKIYLDGNNMLFVDNMIRKMVLSKKGKMAEQKIADLAEKFASITNVGFTHLIFDNTKNAYEKCISKSSNFKLDSA